MKFQKNGYGMNLIIKEAGVMVDRRSKLNKLNNNDGSTMIETVVSFVILMIVFAALYGMVRFSSNLRMRAVDTANLHSQFYSEIYKTGDKDNVDKYNYPGRFAPDDNYTMFYLQPSIPSDADPAAGKTSAYNLKLNNAAVNVSDFNGQVKVPCIDATGYVSTDPRIVTDNLATPKVLVFDYHK